MPKRRITELAPALELAREELVRVMARGEQDRPRVRLIRLDEDAAGRVSPTATGKLGHELERAFLGAKVGQCHARVRVDDRRERDALEVMPLRHHLRTEENRAFRGRKGRQRVGERARPRHGVRVQAEAF
jgi:hypothetical protein